MHTRRDLQYCALVVPAAEDGVKILPQKMLPTKENLEHETKLTLALISSAWHIPTDSHWASFRDIRVSEDQAAFRIQEWNRKNLTCTFPSRGQYRKPTFDERHTYSGTGERRAAVAH